MPKLVSPAPPITTTPPSPGGRQWERARRARQVCSPNIAYGLALLCLLTATLLASNRLLASIVSQPDSQEREALLEIASGVDALAQRFQLDRPAAWLDATLQRQRRLPPPTTAPPAPPAAVPPPPPVAASPPPATAVSQPLSLSQPTATRVGTSAPPTATPAERPVAPTSPPPPPPPTVTAAAALPPMPATTATATRPPAPTATRAPTATATRPPTATPSPTPRPTPRPRPTAALPVRPISPEEPLRLLTIGDSFSEWLGYDLITFGRRSRLVAARLDFTISSGLTQPRYFNWPGRLTEILAQPAPPEAIVFFLGANDTQNMLVNNRLLRPQTPEWRLEYARRVAEVMEIAGHGGSRLYWVGLPVMRDPQRNAIAIDINTAIMTEAATRPWVHFVEVETLFGSADEEYASHRPNAEGELIRVRQDDGIHLTRVGTTWIAQVVYGLVQADWRLEQPARAP